MRELKKHKDAYHVTYLDTRYVSVVQGLSPDLTLIPKPIAIAKTHYSGVASYEGLSFLASGYMEFKNPFNRLGRDEQKGQLVAYLMKTLQNHTSKIEVVGCLSNFHKIIFMRAKRAPNLKTIYCEITKEFDLFGEDTTYEGWKYLFNMLKYNCNEELTISPAIEHNFELTRGKGASSYVYAMNKKSIALKLFAPCEETMHTFKNEAQTLIKLKGIPGLPEILDIKLHQFYSVQSIPVKVQYLSLCKCQQDTLNQAIRKPLSHISSVTRYQLSLNQVCHCQPSLRPFI
ncbi:hypothetical protein C9374_002621 [Naegleria lovaniensis]|uniref:Uncharacterized protein n=1 Tax=Naegleria lovaniensis TaxID=51637 RepID=A0AA88GSQ8_NAELO|nr:uncharacterized protein C9374_002621 [Naegleria lovaniensis]KAG2386175.1 hypothetical protein C9374_002621 [Naegleria lovaniensis]